MFIISNEIRVDLLNYSHWTTSIEHRDQEPNVKGLNRLLQITHFVNTRIQIINNFNRTFSVICVCMCVCVMLSQIRILTKYRRWSSVTQLIPLTSIFGLISIWIISKNGLLSWLPNITSYTTIRWTKCFVHVRCATSMHEWIQEIWKIFFCFLLFTYPNILLYSTFVNHLIFPFLHSVA